jgi:hypothetical protein
MRPSHVDDIYVLRVAPGQGDIFAYNEWHQLHYLQKRFFIRTFSSLYYIFNKTFYLAKWLERLAVNAKVATVLGSILASSDTVESEGRQMKQC